jgi:hypothetical protein
MFVYNTVVLATTNEKRIARQSLSVAFLAALAITGKGPAEPYADDGGQDDQVQVQ